MCSIQSIFQNRSRFSFPKLLCSKFQDLNQAEWVNSQVTKYGGSCNHLRCQKSQKFWLKMDGPRTSIFHHRDDSLSVNLPSILLEIVSFLFIFAAPNSVTHLNIYWQLTSKISNQWKQWEPVNSILQCCWKIYGR